MKEKGPKRTLSTVTAALFKWPLLESAGQGRISGSFNPISPYFTEKRDFPCRNGKLGVDYWKFSVYNEDYESNVNKRPCPQRVESRVMGSLAQGGIFVADYNDPYNKYNQDQQQIPNQNQYYNPYPNPNQNQNQYYYGPNGTGVERGKSAATGSLVCGIVALVFCVIGIFTFWGVLMAIALGIVGIVLAASARRAGSHSGIQTGGFVLSLLGLVFGAIIFIVYVIIIFMILQVYDSYPYSWQYW